MPRRIHILFNLLALFVIVYIAVDTFYDIVGMQLHRMGGQKPVVLENVTRETTQSPGAPTYDVIVKRNIFGATEKAEPLPVEEEPEVDNLEETTLQLSLLGTVAGDPAGARAIILDGKDRKQNIYRVGDSVQGAEIRQILRGKVVLRHGEKDEILTMAEPEAKSSAAARPAVRPSRINRTRQSRAARRAVEEREKPEEANNATGEDATGEVQEEIIPVAQDELQSSINNLNELMTQVRIRPYFRGGQSEGLIVSQIQGNSIFAKLGLMNGDIINSVDGRPLNSPEEAFQFYNSLNSGSRVSIELTRRGQKKMFTYDIE